MSNRPKLSLRLQGDGETALPGATEIMMHAIEHHLCVRARYNRGQVILAPHILYERHGESYVDGVVLERDGVRPAEAKLGAFKLSGLRDLVGMMEPLRLFAGFSHDEPRYAEKIIVSVLG